ncbi:hypothetical protein LG634_12775 [Streptomyces bambusae]|uniref:GtrA family protein n=1 Tax=Streptomyces bambusae TaxID=1550616 RepID=UPI001CFD96CF|nr:GtrA family protein [Streptomyces bambusae]MCB5165706.1 hypothetical protein [Streptomyces bambusae]
MTDHTTGTAGAAEQAARPAAPGPVAAFARFVLCGGGLGLASGAAVAALGGLLPWALANALVTAASTVLGTVLHARFTFGAGSRPGLRQHLQSAGSAAGAYAATTLAVSVLHLLRTTPDLLTEQAVYLTASALAGLCRFLVLRLVVFRTGGGERTAAAAPVPAAPVELRTAGYAAAA